MVSTEIFHKSPAAWQKCMQIESSSMQYAGLMDVQIYLNIWLRGY